ncbi:Por secretion system C-terminal sorting domain-containing protein [Dyadobacter koreensis]|uniref:Por secretion system C-terminal sorting domain-containing protein n=1 Tax=Dyadobacter koreensis TaxID=408657 RepID=A0A1H7ATZ3_9BACT|nr:T9SS type A sorting domain-containing protein [Dyadobacter koreensis]SEJ69073.1 Por secretion system C-terminal sorting domain-containing protein [Dyadobacter koreensis]
MKNVLTIFLTAFLFASVAFKANAQAIDMALQTATVNPSPGVYPGASNISFKVIAEILDQPLSSDDLGISYATISISLSNLQGSAANLPTGPGADLFNWTYDPVLNSYRGSSKDVTMPADIPLEINITNLPTIQVSASNNTGFIANLTPPGDLLASEAVDDAVSFYTNTVLPVTLVSFTVQKEGQTAQLKWATTEETNSDYFEIQHSVSGKEWAKIGQVASSGESSSLKNYTFNHGNPLNGENLYRLKMVDKDQTFAYSRIQSAKFAGLTEGDLSVYPNPTVDVLKIRDFSQVTKVLIYDMNGRAVIESGVSNTGEISVRNLASGIYLVRVNRSNGLTSSQKIVVGK